MKGCYIRSMKTKGEVWRECYVISMKRKIGGGDR